MESKSTSPLMGIKQFTRRVKLPAAKISIIGTPAVGKTTLTKLMRGQQTNNRLYSPTMGFNLGQTIIEGNNVKLWDFGGQKAYLKQHLSKYVHGSDIIFVVTDSSPKNVLTTKELLEHSRSIVEDSCEIVAIANKQDLPGHMSPKRVEDVLQIPTFPMVAIDHTNRNNILELINTLMNHITARKHNE
ncbi:MAG: ADP-ribosylation factor-like protein [Promethearchaeota archaeon]